jgi:hypothetical protein
VFAYAVTERHFAVHGRNFMERELTETELMNVHGGDPFGALINLVGGVLTGGLSGVVYAAGGASELAADALMYLAGLGDGGSGGAGEHPNDLGAEGSGVSGAGGVGGSSEPLHSGIDNPANGGLIGGYIDNPANGGLIVSS